MAGWARDRGLDGLTLTTFDRVPWNRPYYQRLGFVVVEEEDQTAGLSRIRAGEAAAGRDRWPRVAMRRGPAPSGVSQPVGLRRRMGDDDTEVQEQWRT